MHTAEFQFDCTTCGRAQTVRAECGALGKERYSIDGEVKLECRELSLHVERTLQVHAHTLRFVLRTEWPSAKNAWVSNASSQALVDDALVVDELYPAINAEFDAWRRRVPYLLACGLVLFSVILIVAVLKSR